jgi:hypothetical protein
MHQGSAPGQYPGQGQQPGAWGGNNWNGQDNSAMSSAPHAQGYNGGYPTNTSGPDGSGREPDDIDEIIRKATSGIPTKVNGDTQAALPAVQPAAKPQEPVHTPDMTEKNETGEKKSKKDKNTRMVYSDIELSPEERMAKMPRYAFVPDQNTEATVVE